jgi:hypothetical protein
MKRAITTEVSLRLTCIGDAVNTESGYSMMTTESDGGSSTGAGASKCLP